jgi:hypothetical protein
MYYAFPADTSFQTFLKKVQEYNSSYCFVMLTFTGCYATLAAKQRYLQSRLHEHIPLLSVDIHASAQIYHHLIQAFPKVLNRQKLPLHICFKKTLNEKTNRLSLQPVLCNQAVLGDRHFDQLRELLVWQDALEKEQGVTSY